MEPHSRAQIEERIKRLLIAELGVRPAALEGCTAGTPLLGLGVGLDSVETLHLTLGLESEFKISIPDSDLAVELFQSIGTLADYVKRKAAESQ